jgi:hypothetical protein
LKEMHITGINFGFGRFLGSKMGIFGSTVAIDRM